MNIRGRYDRPRRRRRSVRRQHDPRRGRTGTALCPASARPRQGGRAGRSRHRCGHDSGSGTVLGQHRPSRIGEAGAPSPYCRGFREVATGTIGSVRAPESCP
jgi:hypothetical protein